MSSHVDDQLCGEEGGEGGVQPIDGRAAWFGEEGRGGGGSSRLSVVTMAGGVEGCWRLAEGTQGLMRGDRAWEVADQRSTERIAPTYAPSR